MSQVFGDYEPVNASWSVLRNVEPQALIDRPSDEGTKAYDGCQEVGRLNAGASISRMGRTGRDYGGFYALSSCVGGLSIDGSGDGHVRAS